MDHLNAFADDVVSEVLRAVKVHSTVYCLSELGAPWGFGVEGEAVAKFHLVLEGFCWLEPEGQEPVLLSRGELVLLPRGNRHAVRDRPDSAVRGLDRILLDHPVGRDGRLTYGGSGPLTRLLCGGFGLAESLPEHVLALLPDMLRLDAKGSGLAAWLEPIFRLLRQEAGSSSPGANAVFAKIADVFLTQALRSYLVGAQQAGLLELEPLRDPAIARAVDAMQRQPARPWTVAQLARDVGMSRTAFITRFRALVGESPMRYLTRVRLSQAAGHLATTDHNNDAIARLAGYDNDASFSKAFKREFGMAPGQYRRQASNNPILSVR